MSESVLIDTGPLVAAFNRSDQYHAWAREWLGQIEGPLITCEAVLSEAGLLLSRRGGDPLAILKLLKDEVVSAEFSVQREVAALFKLQHSYRDLPMSLADACLVRMSELHDKCRVFTTDAHFRVYRRNQRQIIPLIAPPGI